MLIQTSIEKEIKDFIKKEFAGEDFDSNICASIQVDIPKKAGFGDLATTCPLNLAKSLKLPPIKLAEKIKNHLDQTLSEFCLQIDIAPPGFLNFHLTSGAFAGLIDSLNNEDLISVNHGKDKPSLLIEYVSANPTGDLHLGHGRGAVVGSALVSIIKATGRDVKSEFYINDAGEQIQKLGRSAWKLYKGEAHSEGDEYPKELIEPYVQNLSDNLDFNELTGIVKDRILNKQKEVLASIKVEYDKWVSEKEDVHEKGLLEKTLQQLKDKGLTYEKDDALWLSSSNLGDERDRVLLKSPTQPNEARKPTYLTADIAYHLNKLERANELLDIFGADHQGQEISLKKSLEALGEQPENLNILFIQFVSLSEGGQEVKMSKRTGSVIAVEEVVEKVGSDAFRFMLLASSVNNRVVFDIDLALRSDDQNPVFYVQYAHARACSILRNATESSFDGSPPIVTKDELKTSLTNISIINVALNSSNEKEIQSTKELIIKLSYFNNEVNRSSDTLNPSSLAHYLLDLAALFHNFYTNCRAINKENKELTLARLSIIQAFQKVLNKGLSLLLINAPERM